MFFLSKDARKIYERFSDEKDELALRLACDQSVMMFSLTSIETLLKSQTIYQIAMRDKATMPDYPGVKLRKHLPCYRYITEEFVTHDYSRIDLLKFATSIFVYDFPIVKLCGDRCKNLKHFTIPYLVTVLDNEATEMIEEIRRDARIEDAIRSTPQVSLPTTRPTNLAERFTIFAEDRKIDDALKGKE